jgi:hypothetical protein
MIIEKSDKCKCPYCENIGTKRNKGFCKRHYKKLLEKSKLYYDEMDKEKCPQKNK